MFKRLFWFAIGTVSGIVLATKAHSYVKARVPKHTREFILGEDQDNIPSKTLQGLLRDFSSLQSRREEELDNYFADKFR